jgi:hypothetical protein
LLVLVGVEGVFGEERSWFLKEKGVLEEGVEGSCLGGVWRSGEGELKEGDGEFSGFVFSGAVERMSNSFGCVALDKISMVSLKECHVCRSRNVKISVQLT